MRPKYVVMSIALVVLATAANGMPPGSSESILDKSRNIWEKHSAQTVEQWMALVASSRRYQVKWYGQHARTIVDFKEGVIKVVATGKTAAIATEHLSVAIESSIAEEDVWKTVIDNVTNPSGKPRQIASDTLIEERVVDSEFVVAKTFALPSDHRRRRAEKYAKVINYYSRLQGLRPELVTAVIDAESYFNPKAKSKKGALGLMQLVPKAGGRDAMRLSGREDRDPYAAELFQPETNIDLGTTYLKHLMQRYGFVRDSKAREYLSLAAYNWGQGNVDSQIRPTSSISLQQVIYRLNAAPKETRDYINRIRTKEKIYAAQ